MEKFGRRERKKLKTAASLREAALQLAWSNGLDEITVEDISNSADVTSRTFFNYYASKEDAVLGITKEEAGAWAAPPARAGQSAFEQARLHIRSLLGTSDTSTAEQILMRRVVQGRNPQLIVREYKHLTMAGQQLEPWIVDLLILQDPDVAPEEQAERARTILHVLGAAYQLAAAAWCVDPSDSTPLTDYFDASVARIAAVTRQVVLP